MATEAIVTSISDPVTWAKLMECYNAQGRPGWVLLGNATYQVLKPQVTDGAEQIRFLYTTDKALYEDRSF